METFLTYSIYNIKVIDVLIAIGIFLIAYFVKSFLTHVVIKNLKHLARKTKTTTDDKFIDILEPPMKFSILILGFYLAEEWIDLASFQGITKLIEKTLITFVLFWILFRAVDQFSYIFTKFSSKFGKNLSTDIAANLFGSLVIFTDKPFNKGDWILTPNVEGTIESIGIRSTRVRTFAQALVSVPNAVIANSAITNWSKMGKRRIKMRLGLTYSTNTSQMKNILKELREMLKNHPDVHKKTIMVHFDEFQDSSLSLFCYFFTTTTAWAEYLKVKEDVNLKMMKIIEQNGAGFAFPSQSIYIENISKNEMI